MKIEFIYDKCFKAIGGDENDDVQWYLYKRPKTITRKSFFRGAVFAIWVAGLKRKSVDTFLSRAEENGFNYDFRFVAKQKPAKWKQFQLRRHGKKVPQRSAMKWNAIRELAIELCTFKDEKQFREEWFDGKVKSSRLTKEDVNNLQNRKLSFIGPANSHFIIRNIGGESIKCDRWLKAFVNYFKISESQLLKYVEKANIPAGLFDIVIWAYCEKFINKISSFNSHFNTHFKGIRR